MKRRRPPSEAPLPHQKPTRAARLKGTRREREQDTLRRGELRHDVILRAAGRCEWCHAQVPPGELHHILSGSKRREEERLNTLAFVCVPCHHAYHRNDIDTLFRASSWANIHGFDDARTAIQHRVAKVNEAKWASLRRTA